MVQKNHNARGGHKDLLGQAPQTTGGPHSFHCSLCVSLVLLPSMSPNRHGMPPRSIKNKHTVHLLGKHSPMTQELLMPHDKPEGPHDRMFIRAESLMYTRNPGLSDKEQREAWIDIHTEAHCVIFAKTVRSLLVQFPHHESINNVLWALTRVLYNYGFALGINVYELESPVLQSSPSASIQEFFLSLDGFIMQPSAETARRLLTYCQDLIEQFSCDSGYNQLVLVATAKQ